MSLTFITLWRVVRVGMQDAIILPEVFAQRLSCQIRIITTFLSERRWLRLFLWKNSVNVLQPEENSSQVHVVHVPF